MRLSGECLALSYWFRKNSEPVPSTPAVRRFPRLFPDQSTKRVFSASGILKNARMDPYPRVFHADMMK